VGGEVPAKLLSQLQKGLGGEGGCYFPLPGGSRGSFAGQGSGPRGVLGWKAWDPLSPRARALLKTVLIPPSSTDPVRTRKLLCSKSSFTVNENL